MDRPETRYARSGDVHVGYQATGQGPADLVLVDQWFSNVDAVWRLAPFARLVERLATFSRVIMLDKRGTGVSDPVPLGGLPTLEEWMDDIRAVLDAVGSARTALLAGIGSSYLALLFAATYPDRTSALILVDGYARLTRADDYLPELPEVMTADEVERLRSAWGSGILLRRLAPTELHDAALIRSFGEYERQSASPGMAAAMLRLLYESDVRDVLPAIQVPTLVITHTESARIPAACSRYLAEHIPGARAVELPGSENLIWAGNSEALLGDVQEFVTGIRPAVPIERVLATVMFTDIVDSTNQAAHLGDQRWREILAEHDRLVRTSLERFRGREIKTTGDGFLATFDGPARAIRCARQICTEVRAIGLHVRTGLHTGEIELAEQDIQGIAVHVAARVAARAGPGEVLVSSTVKDLVVGSGIEFEDRGSHQLKGVPGEWRLFTVTSE